jgi:hypothetical protein
VVPAFIKSLVVVALIIEGCIIHWRLVVECLGFVGLVVKGLVIEWFVIYKGLLIEWELVIDCGLFVKGSLLVRLRFILRWSLVNLLICRKLILS